MDQKTINYYSENAQAVAARYESVVSSLSESFQDAFKARVSPSVSIASQRRCHRQVRCLRVSRCRVRMDGTMHDFPPHSQGRDSFWVL